LDKPHTQIYMCSLHDALPIHDGNVLRNELAQRDGEPTADAHRAEGERLPDVEPGGAGVARGSGSMSHTHLEAEEAPATGDAPVRSEEHTSELQSRENVICRLL